jgi:hypothetical protein
MRIIYPMMKLCCATLHLHLPLNTHATLCHAHRPGGQRSRPME